MYLHIKEVNLLPHVPLNAECYPLKDNNVLVKFNQKDNSENRVTYILAADNPREFLSTITKDPIIHNSDGSQSFTIDYSHSYHNPIMRPLRKFYLYMRSMGSVKQSSPLKDINKTPMQLSRLSQPIKCATQGFHPSFSKRKEGITFTWEAGDVMEEITFFTIQFKSNRSSSSIELKDFIIGTYNKSPSLQSLYENNNLVTIPIISSKNYEEDGFKRFDILIPGNTTGIFIPKVEEINIRILGSTNSDGSLFKQNLTYLEWFTILPTDISVVPIELIDVEARNAKIAWKDFGGVECARICTQNKETVRESSKLNCEKM